MNKDIRLYIGGQLVEFNDNPSIEFTYQTTDYTNPTVYKIGYTKTITIDGTPNNNNIFNHIWNLERIMDTDFTLYNPSQRVDFELYHNSELIENGYCKLDSIERGHTIAYNITLYGGLGSFFYSLSYDLNSDKKKTLADLNYLGTSNPDGEFDFVISKDTVKEAWGELQKNPNGHGKWNCFNFMTAYNGLPESFDSNKALLNTNGLKDLSVRYTTDEGLVTSTFPTVYTTGEDTYKPRNGYVMAEMNSEHNEWQMRDLRSYLQRPALSVKSLINAISDPQNNGGYNVSLDNDFFSSGNPYYSKAWITLPMLTNDTEWTDKIIKTTWNKAEQYYDINGKLNYRWRLVNSGQLGGTPSEISMSIELHATITGTTAEKLYTSAINQRPFPSGETPPEEEYIGCTVMQLYGFSDYGEDNWYYRDAKCGSNVICLTSKVAGRYIQRSQLSESYSGVYSPTDYIYNFGYWKKVSGSDYVWHNETDNVDAIYLSVDTSLLSETPNLGIAFASFTTKNDHWAAEYGGWAFPQQYYYDGDMINERKQYWKHMSMVCLESNTYYNVLSKMRSFRNITKKDLLGGVEGTPCDWLLSYCKLFGLFIEKDKYENTIYIKMRNNWYKDETVNLEDFIDRSKEANITPLTFETKWYDFNYGEAESKYLDRYKEQYGQDFGKQLIDTKYNFDAEDIDLIEDTRFRNGLEAVERSNYFNVKKDGKGFRIPQCLFDWCTVSYYSDDNAAETNMALPKIHTIELLNDNMPNEFYDAFPKMVFHDTEDGATDGDNVLVFFNGFVNTGNDRYYWLTDDIDEMFTDSENPCWLATESETDENGIEIATRINLLPSFERYETYKNNIGATWDFGYTKELYVPYYRYNINKTPTIYENFWKSYIEDLYSVNTRKVDCYVNIDTNSVYDFLKRFYWWDNSIWVCTKIDNFDKALNRSTLCSFTKVNDKEHYLEMPTFDDFYFKFIRIGNTGNIPWSGTTDELTATFQVDSSSQWMVINEGQPFVHFENGGMSVVGPAGIGNEVKAIFMPNLNEANRQVTFVGGNNEGNTVFITVVQDGKKKPKYLNLDRDYIEASKNAATYNITVNSSSNWYAYGGNSWITASTMASGSGYTTVSFTLSANNTKEDRTAEYLFANNDGLQCKLKILQKHLVKATIESNTKGREIEPSGGTFYYTVVSDTDWSLKPLNGSENYVECEEWGIINGPTTGTVIEFHALENDTPVDRNIYFALELDDDISIYPYENKVILGSYEHFSIDGSATALTATKDARKTYSIDSSKEWAVPTVSGNNISMSVEANSGSVRECSIYVYYYDEEGNTERQIITISQNGDTPYLSVSPTEVELGSNGGQFIINVSSSSEISYSGLTEWIKPLFRSLNSALIFEAEKNNLNVEREATITVSNSDGYSVDIDITQATSSSSEYTLDYSMSKSEFGSEGGIGTLIIRTNSPWEIIDENE